MPLPVNLPGAMSLEEAQRAIGDVNTTAASDVALAAEVATRTAADVAEAATRAAADAALITPTWIAGAIIAAGAPIVTLPAGTLAANRRHVLITVTAAGVLVAAEYANFSAITALGLMADLPGAVAPYIVETFTNIVGAPTVDGPIRLAILNPGAPAPAAAGLGAFPCTVNDDGSVILDNSAGIVAAGYIVARL
ncbi:MAG: hypothetical protein HY719_13720 [Planctomycetes bacterium]|nr:hypothetical protein [Planctomycetota bacterium]